MQRSVGVGRHAAQARGLSEEIIVLIHEIVDDLTFASQRLHCPLRGRRLQQRSVMVDVIKGDKPCLQEKTSFLI